MSVVLGLKHDRLLREQAVEMFERGGCGYGLRVTGQFVCLLVACCVVLGFVFACPAFSD